MSEKAPSSVLTIAALAALAGLVVANTRLVGMINPLSLWYAGFFPRDAPGVTGRGFWAVLMILVGVIGFPAVKVALLKSRLRRRRVPQWPAADLLVFVAGAAAVAYDFVLAPQWVHGTRLPLPGLFYTIIDGGYLIVGVPIVATGIALWWIVTRRQVR